jgi:hypothetical protein
MHFLSEAEERDTRLLEVRVATGMCATHPVDRFTC